MPALRSPAASASWEGLDAGEGAAFLGSCGTAVSPLCSHWAAQHPTTVLGWGDFPPWLSEEDAWVLPPWHGLEGGCLSGLDLPLGVKIPPRDSNASWPWLVEAHSPPPLTQCLCKWCQHWGWGHLHIADTCGERCQSSARRALPEQALPWACLCTGQCSIQQHAHQHCRGLVLLPWDTDR